MLVQGRTTLYPEASLAAEWTGSLVHFPACPDMQQLACQWAWQKQCWKTWQENSSPKLLSVSGRKRKGSVRKLLHHLFSLVHWCLAESHLLLLYLLYLFFSKSTKFLQILPWLGQKKLSFPLESADIKTPSQNNLSCLRALGLEQQQHVAGDLQIIFLCSFWTGCTTQPPKNLPPTAPGGSGILTAISCVSEARFRPSGLK